MSVTECEGTVWEGTVCGDGVSGGAVCEGDVRGNTVRGDVLCGDAECESAVCGYCVCRAVCGGVECIWGCAVTGSVGVSAARLTLGLWVMSVSEDVS